MRKGVSLVAFTIAFAMPVFSSRTTVVAGIPLSRVASCGTLTTLIAVFPGFWVIRAGMKSAVWFGMGRESLRGMDMEGAVGFVFVCWEKSFADWSWRSFGSNWEMMDSTSLVDKMRRWDMSEKPSRPENQNRTHRQKNMSKRPRQVGQRSRRDILTRTT